MKRRRWLACVLLVLAGCGGAHQPDGTAGSGNPGDLSDERMVGQLFYGVVYGSGPSTVTPLQRRINTEKYGVGTPAEVVARWHLGGVILIDRNTLDPAWGAVRSGNVDTAATVRALTAGLQEAAARDSGVPLLIGTDQEGGAVQRITDGVDSRPAQAAIADLPAAQLRCDYFRLGSQLRALGVNQDFAPDADVLRVASSVIGDRSFGADPGLVSADVEAAADGLRDAGVLPTLKHWPGHGGVSSDSHQTLPALPQSLDSWRRTDRPPFASALHGWTSVMVGHLAFPAADSSGLPATLSPSLVRGLLRTDLGFNQLVVTDSLFMRPMQDAGTPPSVARQAIEAGDDMLLMSPDLPAAFTELLSEVKRNPDFRQRVRESVARVLAAKEPLANDSGPPTTCG